MSAPQLPPPPPPPPPVAGLPPPPPGKRPPFHPLAIASLVCALLVPMVGPLLAIPVGVWARRRIRASEGRWDGMELAAGAIIVSVGLIALVVLGAVLVVVGLSLMADQG